MSEYTPITTDLRLLIGCFTTKLTDFERDKFNQLCDVLDSIHAALEAENNDLKVKYVNANRKSIDLEAKCERLCEQHDKGWVRLPCDGEAPSKQLAEWIESRGLVTGPLDANGELWHKGDMSDSPWGEIESIAFDGYHWQVSGHDTSAPWIPADSISHYRPDTWERIIMDAIDAVDDCWANDEHDKLVDALVARCKALAGDAE